MPSSWPSRVRRVEPAARARPKSVSAATPVAVEQDVRRLHVAVQDPVVVEDVESLAELRREVERLVEADGSCLEPAGKRASAVERHHQVGGLAVVARLEDLDDVRRADLARDPRLAQEAGPHHGLARHTPRAAASRRPRPRLARVPGARRRWRPRRSVPRARSPRPGSRPEYRRGRMIEYLLLGPLEARVDGVGVELPGGRPRAVLARLLLEEGRVVPVEGLLEALWGHRPPPSAPKVLQAHVSQLRKVLGAGAIETQAPGYRVTGTATDLARFEELTGAARGEQSPAKAAKLYGRALELWRGRALAEFRREPFAARGAPARGAAARCARGADRGRAFPGRARAPRRRAGGARRAGAAARAAAPTAHARALPLGPPGRGARVLPRRPAAARGRARDRAEPRPAGARARDPPPRRRQRAGAFGAPRPGRVLRSVGPSTSSRRSRPTGASCFSSSS